MSRIRPPIWLIVTLLCASCTSNRWADRFDVDTGELSTIGANRYFILVPGYQLCLAGEEKGKHVELLITVLHDVHPVYGVKTRVVEERESVDGQVVEVSRNFFAISASGDVYYFGEEVDIYRDGKISSHGGSWIAGRDGARYGLMVPGSPQVGQKAYQEIAPDVAMDRFEVIATDRTERVPAGEFTDCLVTEETTPLEPDSREQKIYAPKVGLIVDGKLRLVRYGAAE